MTHVGVLPIRNKVIASRPGTSEYATAVEMIPVVVVYMKQRNNYSSGCNIIYNGYNTHIYLGTWHKSSNVHRVCIILANHQDWTEYMEHKTLRIQYQFTKFQ